MHSHYRHYSSVLLNSTSVCHVRAHHTVSNTIATSNLSAHQYKHTACLSNANTAPSPVQCIWTSHQSEVYRNEHEQQFRIQTHTCCTKRLTNCSSRDNNTTPCQTFNEKHKRTAAIDIVVYLSEQHIRVMRLQLHTASNTELQTQSQTHRLFIQGQHDSVSYIQQT